MNILTYPNEMLQVTCTELDLDNLPFNPEEKKAQLLDLIKEYALAGKAATGISANQVGDNLRYMMIENRQTNQNYDRQQFIMNPEILESSDTEIEMFEASASFPDIVLKVSRADSIKVRFTNEFGKVREETLKGYSCRFFQHYFDLLNGVTFNEHVSPAKWKEAVAKAEAKRK